MKALVFNGPMDMTVEDVAEPAAGPEDVILDVLAVGICGSDVHGYAGTTGRRQPGMVMGHEACGRIASAGASVGSWASGQTVTFNPVLGCGRCRMCAAGLTNRCLDRRVIGVEPAIVGAFAERIAVPAANLHPAADVTAATLAEPLAVGLNAVRQLDLAGVSSLAVVGAGMIGLACLWAARREGVGEVYVGDIDPAKVGRVQAAGGTALALAGTSLPEALREHGAAMVDAVIDATGLSQTSSDALRATRPGGRVCLVGMASPVLQLPAYDIATAERSVVGSFCYTQDTFAECARAVSAGEVDPQQFVDHTVTLDEAPDAFRELASGGRSSVKTTVVVQDTASRDDARSPHASGGAR